MNYIDLHCDTLYRAALEQRPDIGDICAMADLKRLRASGTMAQFFAIFMPEREEFLTHPHLGSDEAYIRQAADILDRTIERYPGQIALARNMEELECCQSQGTLAAFLTLEDGRAVDGRMENLERFYGLGIRLITLTWNYENCFGHPNSTDARAMDLGLKPFGRDAVRRMEELGMLVDVSHLSDGGFWEVAHTLRGPFVASHSNCRALCPHPRNLTDDMIRAVADHGGVVGLNFCPSFLNMEEESTIAAMLAHLRHLIQVGGRECVALGTDFDGIHGRLELQDAGQMHRLFRAMDRAGFTGEEQERFAWKNAVRVIREGIKLHAPVAYHETR